MEKQTFTQIRERFPSDFLLLLNYEGKELPEGRIDVVAAEEVRAFDSGDKTMAAYKELRQSGKKIMFCTPDYKERLIIEKLPAMIKGIIGNNILAPHQANIDYASSLFSLR